MVNPLHRLSLKAIAGTTVVVLVGAHISFLVRGEEAPTALDQALMIALGALFSPQKPSEIVKHIHLPGKARKQHVEECNDEECNDAEETEATQEA